jgi:general secretion pathway protein F
MPVYEYTALDRAGKNQKGIIDADNPQAARQRLRGSDIFPIELKETFARPKSLTPDHISISSIFHRVSPGEISSMTRQLATLLSSGMTLVLSLEALIDQTTNPLFKKILAEIKESVNEGNSFASSLSQHPKNFSQVYINMVRAGEASGSLDLVLERLADLSEDREALKGRFKAAMAYPIIMCIVGVIALMVLVTFVVPRFVAVFDQMEQSLPLPTLFVIGASNFLKAFWWAVVIFIMAVIYILRRLINTPGGRYLWDKIKFRAPVFGIMNIKMAMAAFGRTLGSLVQSGVPLISSLQIVKNVVNNNIFTDVIDKTIEEVQAGKSLAAPLSRAKWIPPVVIQMISVGEQSGDLERMLNKIADIYEREVESQITMLTSMLEPAIILIMAVIVGFIAFSIVLPIVEMSQVLH